MADDGGSIFWRSFARNAVLIARDLDRRERAKWWSEWRKHWNDFVDRIAILLSWIVWIYWRLLLACFLFGLVLMLIHIPCGKAVRYEPSEFYSRLSIYDKDYIVDSMVYELGRNMLRVTRYCEFRWCGFIVPVCAADRVIRAQKDVEIRKDVFRIK